MANQFKKCREARGLTLKDVSDSLRVHQSYLTAIEDEDFSIKVESVYIIGFIASYARFLGIDHKEIVDRYKNYMKLKHEERSKSIEIPEKKETIIGLFSKIDGRSVEYVAYVVSTLAIIIIIAWLTCYYIVRG